MLCEFYLTQKKKTDQGTKEVHNGDPDKFINDLPIN